MTEGKMQRPPLEPKLMLEARGEPGEQTRWTRTRWTGNGAGDLGAHGTRCLLADKPVAVPGGPADLPPHLASIVLPGVYRPLSPDRKQQSISKRRKPKL